MQFLFRQFEKADLPVLRSWFADSELARRLSYPSDEWFAHVSGGNASRCWSTWSVKGEMVAEVQVDREGAERGYIEFCIRPDLRGRGLGIAALDAFILGPGKAYLILDGRIAPDNYASLTCCRRCGFQLSPEPDEDGFIRAVRCAS
jgi:RimJ/RimL family protein N-acetyltransferase